MPDHASDSPSTITVSFGDLRAYNRSTEVMRSTFQYHRAAVPQIFRDTATPPPTRAWVRDLLEDGGAFLVAEAGDRIVGFLTVRVGPTPDVPYLRPGRLATVDNLGVLPAYQRSGVGRMLMRAAEAWAGEQGAERLQLNVWEFNQSAIGFYDSLGYTTYSRNMWRDL